MIAVVIATIAAGAVAAFIYVGRERLGLEGLGFAALRTIAFGALFLALFNPGRISRIMGGPPTVLLDASLSMGAAGGRWQDAMDTALVLVQGTDGGGGTILRFGAGVTPYDSTPPGDGASRIRDALEATVARGGAVYVVSDGEILDGATLPPSLAHGIGTIVLPRDTAANAALLDVAMPRLVQRDDSITATLVIGTWGPLESTPARVAVFAGTRRLLRRDVSLPPAPGRASRRLTLSPGLLPAGTHVLRFRMTAGGDDEPRDDERFRVVTVTEQPGIVVLVDPADVEGRFLTREIAEVARTSVRGFARVQDGLWIDMSTLVPATEASVRAAARGAGLLIIRGADRLGLADRAMVVWLWPAASDPATEFFAGDWYVTRQAPTSPIAGRLAAAAWDSVPPLTGIVPLVPASAEWIAMTGRLARRGADRPLLIGRDSSGVRRLTTAGTGLWRWVLRGGAAREAYRTLIAAGTDWLLRTQASPGDAVLAATPETPRGLPVTFQWRAGDAPDSVVVTMAGNDSTRTITLRFDARGIALVLLEPGIYRWTAASIPGAGGVTVVEDYSDEFHPRAVTLGADVSASGFQLIVRRAREVWWLFGLAMVALLVEWGWRQRRGLP